MQKFFSGVLFYGIVFLTGIVIVPALAIIAPVFILCGIIAPAAGLAELVGWLLGFNVPFVSFEFGSFEINPAIGFALSLIAGILLYALGKLSWKLLLRYFRWVKSLKKELIE